MSIMRFKKGKKNPYFQMHNSTVNDPLLSWQSKGLLAYLISKPDNWYVNYNDLVSAGPSGIKYVRSIINELIKTGYIIRSQLRSNNGHFGFDNFTIYEKPILPKSFKNRIAPYSPKRHAVTRHALKGTLLNTDKKDNTERKKTTAALVVNTNNAAADIPIQNKDQHPDNSNIHKISPEHESLIERKKIDILELFDEMNIHSSEKLFDSFPIDDIFKYCRWIKERGSVPKNPTGYLITAIKEKWLEEVTETIEHNEDRYHWYKCSECSRDIGFLSEMPNFTICQRCKKEKQFSKT